MGKSSGNALKELEQRKKSIEAELLQIQYDVDSSFDSIKEKFLASVIPVKAIQKNPFKAVGIAVLTGITLGLPRLTKKKGVKSNHREKKGIPRGITSYMLDELKRIAARRAVYFFVDTLDEQLVKKTGENGYGRDRDGERKTEN